MKHVGEMYESAGVWILITKVWRKELYSVVHLTGEHKNTVFDSLSYQEMLDMFIEPDDNTLLDINLTAVLEEVMNETR